MILSNLFLHPLLRPLRLLEKPCPAQPANNGEQKLLQQLGLKDGRCKQQNQGHMHDYTVQKQQAASAQLRHNPAASVEKRAADQEHCRYMIGHIEKQNRQRRAANRYAVLLHKIQLRWLSARRARRDGAEIKIQQRITRRLPNRHLVA